MKYPRVILFIFGLVLSFSVPAFANNLQITNVSLDERRMHSSTVLAVVKFDISWDSSWRNTTNYDAVWLVFKTCIGSCSQLYTHSLVYTDSIYGVKSSVGTNEDLEFAGGGTGVTGIFLQRSSSGTGTVSSKDVKVTIAPGATATQNIIVKVIGIEMVYIPQGPFYAGDGGSGTTGSLVKTTTTYDPWYIASEAAIRTTAVSTGSFFYRTGGSSGEFTTGSIFTIPAEFPKGYDAFYCMKYEVTEGQYADFINSLSTTYQTNRDITSGNGTTTGKGTDNVLKRNTMSISGGTATTSRTDRAMSWISWADLAAYFDWVGLRPMTELEYEKIARGDAAALIGEYAWGSSTSITAGVTFSGSPEDGNETFTTASANANYNVTTFSQGDDFLGTQYAQGPVRAGIFAAASSTRTTSGAGYYGPMELSGNVSERVVTIGNTTGTSFFAVNGDGTLNSLSGYEGNALQLGWPGTPDYGERGVDGSTGAGAGFKGGHYFVGASYLKISDRSQTASNDGFRSASGTSAYGGRGVRSLSPPTLPTCGNETIEPPEQCDTPQGQWPVTGCPDPMNDTCDPSTCVCVSFAI
ncbi:MAG: hypothetical protein A2787_04360 [Omnitrophica WOR_2 bacterium RIFCSPHIGHO2_01_FULL_48_9]|nr:MAG: hypothetical protein A2787_04360 [Omnitrophica WOR_2 bacterium RIFCSPHIGHO2_01_FULL_48_9]